MADLLWEVSMVVARWHRERSVMGGLHGGEMAQREKRSGLHGGEMVHSELFHLLTMAMYSSS